MPKQTIFKENIEPGRKPSIRDKLEEQAWAQNPDLANRLNNRLEGGKRHYDEPPRTMRLQDRILITLGFVLLLLLVMRVETSIADESWGLQLTDDSGVHTELAINTDIRLAITGLVGRVEITQSFTNHGSHWAEGIYRFPLPEGAAVDQMRIQVGERLLEGEIQEKESARQTYQQARDAGQTATIVEQQRRNQFETRLANIGPGENIEITIAYLQNVSYSDFSYHLRLPMTFTPRWEPGQQTPGGPHAAPERTPHLIPSTASNSHGLTVHANLVTAVELVAIESRYHDVDIRQTENGYLVELLNPHEVSDRDFVLSWTPTFQSGPSVSLTTYNDGDSVYAQLMLAPPLADAINPQPREVILVIDTSGSMEGASLDQARAALLHALSSLGPDDYFNLLEFNSETRQLFDQSIAVTPTSIHAARNFINGLKANGGTNMAPALRMALGAPDMSHLMRQVIFITDGAVGNETEMLQKVAGDLGNTRMFTVAIGHAPNSWFMRKTAEIGRGSFVHIGKTDEVESQMSALWRRIQVPALTDIGVYWGENAEYFPEVIPDLYAGEPLWLLARLPAEPTMIGLYGQFNDRDWDMNVNGWDAVSDVPGGDNLAKLWARKKIEALEDGLLFGADTELTQLEITGLAIDYGLLTRFTSMVAVDKTPRRDSNDLLAMADVPGLLPTGSSAQLAGYPSTATGWVAQLLLSLLVLLLATFMLLFSGSRLPVTRLAAD